MSTNLTLTPLGGYSAPIALNCTTTATGSTCTPQTAQPTLTAVTVMPVAITTTSQYTVIGYSGFGGTRHHPWLTLVAMLLALVSAGAVFAKGGRRKLLPRLAALLLTFGLLAGATTGCGTRDPDRNANPTYPGTYTYTVTASDGILTHTATYTLSVAIRY